MGDNLVLINLTFSYLEYRANPKKSKTGLFRERTLVIRPHCVRKGMECPALGMTAEYGRYLLSATGCQDCHGTDLSGGKSADPAAMAAPNLTPGGVL